MLTAQLGVSIIEAFTRLRAHAAATHRPVLDVSRDIIAHRVQLPMPDNPD